MAVDPTLDDVIRDLAARQHGVVARRQLLAAGAPPHRISYRVRIGRLTPLFRGVYRAGPVPTPLEGEAAALLACGPESVLSHVSAARIWSMADGVGKAIHISLMRGQRRSGRARPLIVHRPGRLDRADLGRRHGLRLTLPARTALDCAACCDVGRLARILESARGAGIGLERRLAVLMKRHPRSPGIGRLRIALSSGQSGFTRSEAERRFLALVDQAGIAPPRTNAPLLGFEVDTLWPEARLVAEIDGFSYHSSARAFEWDRRRDAVLTAGGYRVMRITWKQLVQEPVATAVRLARALSAGVGPSTVAGT